MKYSSLTAMAVAASFSALSSCSTVPITGRRQLNLVSDNLIMALSHQQYEEFLKGSRLSRNPAQVSMVRRVGTNIQKAVETYFAENDLAGRLAGFAWEYNTVESDEINAFCLPGGKIVVFTGLLPVAKTEAGLAVVMAHEIAHAVARHGNERMSLGLLQQMGGMVLETALEEKPQQTRALWMTVFGLGSQLGMMLPYSRAHEYEADRLGMIFMAMAGDDPAAALEFWQRMSAQGGNKPPEFLSTHPSDESRIARMRELLPEAARFYRKPRP